MLWSQDATHDCDRVLEHLKRLALFFRRRVSVHNYALSLLALRRFAEAKRVLRKVAPVARRVLGDSNDLTLSLREDLSRATLDGESSAEEKRQALQMLEDTVAVMRRVLGPAHPDTLHAQSELKMYRSRRKSRAHGVR